MNRLRDSFVRKLLTVYYASDIKKLEGLSVREGADFYHKHFRVSLRAGGEEYLIMKQYEGAAPLEWRLNNAGADTSVLDPFAFGMRLKNEDYVYFLGSGPVCDDKVASAGPGDFILLTRRLRPFAGIVADDGEGELGVPLTPERIRCSDEGLRFTDINGLCRHAPGYPFWGLYFGFGLSADDVSVIMDRYYESEGIDTSLRQGLKRRSFQEYVSLNKEACARDAERIFFG